MGRTDEVQFLLECAKAWQGRGARVTFQAGWESRGNGLQGNYEGVIVHHTAFVSSQANPNPALNTLINGRPDLAGPLCNVTGPWCTDPWLHVIAAYPANHAGASGGRSLGPLPVTTLFNPRVLGLEVDYAGLTPMTAGQYRAALIFARGVCDVLGRSVEYARAHAETSVTGKWDAGYANGKTIDMAAFRRDAANITATPGGDWFDMATKEELLSILRSEGISGGGDFGQHKAVVTQTIREMLPEIGRAVLCLVPEDREGAWAWDRLARIEELAQSIADKIGGGLSGGSGGGISRDDVKAAVQEALREGTGASASSPAA